MPLDLKARMVTKMVNEYRYGTVFKACWVVWNKWTYVMLASSPIFHSIYSYLFTRVKAEIFSDISLSFLNPYEAKRSDSKL